MPAKTPQLHTQKTPKLRFPGFSDGWEEEKLGEVSKFFSGGTPLSASRKYYSGLIPFIKSGEISKTKTEEFITKEAIEESSAKLVKKGDLLYALYGATSGAVAISQIDGAINQAILCIQTDEDKNWLLNYLLHNKGKILAKFLQGGQGNLSADIVKNLKLTFPSLPEQKKIAEFLGVVEEWIQNLRVQKEYFESYKKGLMQKIFSQGIRFKDAQGNEFPKWEDKKLGEVAEIIMGQSPDSSAYNSEGNGKYLIQGNADITGRETTPRNWTTQITKQCKVGDIIMTVRAPVGYIAKSLYDACIGRGVCAIRNKETSNINFLYQFLLFFEKSWVSLEQGSTFTAVNTQDVKKLKLQIPILLEQQKIAEFLTSVDNIIESKQQQITQAEQWKKGLMQGLFV